jgi:hypothetical protein
MIRLTCACGKGLKAPPHLAGRVVLCSRCKSPLTVPFVSASEGEGPIVATLSETSADSILVQCGCGQHFMAHRNLHGKRVPCPMCARPIVIPSSSPDSEEVLVVETEYEDDAEADYQLAPCDNSTRLPLEKIALKSTMAALGPPMIPTDPMTSSEALPLVGPMPAGSPSLRVLPAATGTVPSPSPSSTHSKPDEEDSAVSAIMFRSFVTLIIAGLCYFGLDYLENSPGNNTFKAPWWFIIVYALTGKTGILVFFILVSLAIMGIAAYEYSKPRRRRR